MLVESAVATAKSKSKVLEFSSKMPIFRISDDFYLVAEETTVYVFVPGLHSGIDLRRCAEALASANGSIVANSVSLGGTLELVQHRGLLLEANGSAHDWKRVLVSFQRRSFAPCV